MIFFYYHPVLNGQGFWLKLQWYWWGWWWGWRRQRWLWSSPCLERGRHCDQTSVEEGLVCCIGMGLDSKTGRGGIWCWWWSLMRVWWWWWWVNFNCISQPQPQPCPGLPLPENLQYSWPTQLFNPRLGKYIIAESQKCWLIISTRSWSIICIYVSWQQAKKGDLRQNQRFHCDLNL